MSSTTQTGTAALEGRLWSVRADDWAAIQERQVAPAYETALGALRVGPSTRLLDAGCGAGMFLRRAADRGADVHGLDASEGVLAHACGRVPGAEIVIGELEQLPYEDASFDLVTGFNSFQYALFGEAGLDVVAVGDTECVWVYPDEPTAITRLMCSGPVVGVAEHAGEQAVHNATVAFLEPFRTGDGSYRITNVFRHVIGNPRS